MAYLHCHKCRWSQDDSYGDDYNPARYLASWNTYLYGSKKERLDQQFTTDIKFVRDNGALTIREVIARYYERFGEQMKWVTFADFRRDKDAGTARRPQCGSANDFDID